MSSHSPSGCHSTGTGAQTSAMDELAAAVSMYARGWFPMDDPAEPDLPWYAPDPRTVFELDAGGLARVRRAVRRSLGRDPGWRLDADRAFDEVVAACAARPETWITPRLAELYGRLHADGWAHSLELWDGERLAAGMLGVAIGRAVMLESMFHRVPHAGNVLVVRALELLAARGVELCDVQLPTDHTRRLGARDIPRAEYEARLRAALS